MEKGEKKEEKIRRKRNGDRRKRGIQGRRPSGKR